jgi:hypothetical protein
LMVSASTPPSVGHIVVGPVDLNFTDATLSDIPVGNLEEICNRLPMQLSYVTQEVRAPSGIIAH